ncbi:MAG: hypothetical protein Q8O87_00680 [bacterium]|nr:hypothetical protein [bacterium]
MSKTIIKKSNRGEIAIKNIVVVVGLVIVFILVLVLAGGGEDRSGGNGSGQAGDLYGVYQDRVGKYSIEYPSWWNLTKPPQISGAKISDPAGNVVVFASYRGSAGDNSILAAEEEYKHNSSYKLKSFARANKNGNSVYMAEGVYDDSETLWNFTEKGVLVSGSLITITAYSDRAVAHHYEATIARILFSFTLAD